MLRQHFRLSISGLIFVLLPGLPLSALAANDKLVLEETLVTARKRTENLQETPVSITALTAATLESAKLLDIKDIEGLTPNLNFIVGGDGSGSTLQAFIRGIGQFDFAVEFGIYGTDFKRDGCFKLVVANLLQRLTAGDATL